MVNYPKDNLSQYKLNLFKINFPKGNFPLGKIILKYKYFIYPMINNSLREFILKINYP